MNFAEISHKMRLIMEKQSSLSEDVEYTPGLSAEVLGRLRNIELAKQGFVVEENLTQFNGPLPLKEQLREKKKLDYSQAFKAGLFLDKQKEIQRNHQKDKESLVKISVESPLNITYSNLRAAFSRLLNKKFNTDFYKLYVLIKGNDIHVKYNDKDKYITKSMTPMLYKQSCYSGIQLMTLDKQPTEETIFYVSYLFDYSTTFPRDWELIARQIFEIILKNIKDALDFEEFPRLIKKQYPKNDANYLCINIDLYQVSYDEKTTTIKEVQGTKIGGVSVIRNNSGLFRKPTAIKIDQAVKDSPITGALLPDWDQELETKVKQAKSIYSGLNTESVDLHSAMSTSGFNRECDLWRNCYQESTSDDSGEEIEFDEEINMLLTQRREKIMEILKQSKIMFKTSSGATLQVNTQKPRTNASKEEKALSEKEKRKTTKRDNQILKKKEKINDQK